MKGSRSLIRNSLNPNFWVQFGPRWFRKEVYKALEDAVKSVCSHLLVDCQLPVAYELKTSFMFSRKTIRGKSPNLMMGRDHVTIASSFAFSSAGKAFASGVLTFDNNATEHKELCQAGSNEYHSFSPHSEVVASGGYNKTVNWEKKRGLIEYYKMAELYLCSVFKLK